MTTLLKWLLPTLLLAGLVHGLTVALLPQLVMDRVHGAIAAEAGLNAEGHAPRATAESRTVVKPSPDLLYTICAFDLAEGPLRVRAIVPAAMWSLAVYDDRGDNVFALDGAEAGGPGAEVEMVLTWSGDRRPERLGFETVALQDFEGLVLFRTLVESEARLAELDGTRRQAECAPLDLPDGTR